MSQPRPRPILLSETGNDEAFLLGTREQLTWFASQILELVAASSVRSSWHGVAVSLPQCSHSLTEPMSELAVSGVALVESEADARTLANKIRVDQGSDPIDWQDTCAATSEVDGQPTD